jgi:hypothetical protein
MFIELAGGAPELHRSDMLHMSLLWSSGRHCASHSINIPRFWRSGIMEFAGSIPSSSTPKAAAISIS